MDSSGGFAPIETFVSFGRRSKRAATGSKKSAEPQPESSPSENGAHAPISVPNTTVSEPPRDPPQKISPALQPEVQSLPSASNAVPLTSFGGWDDGEGEKIPFGADAWGAPSSGGDEFFNSLSAAKQPVAVGTPAPKPTPFVAPVSTAADFLGGGSAADYVNTDFLASLTPSTSASLSFGSSTQPSQPSLVSAAPVFHNHAAVEPPSAPPVSREPPVPVENVPVATSAIAPVVASTSAPAAVPLGVLPPPAGGASAGSRAGGRGRRQMVDLAAMMTQHTSPSAGKPREPPMPSSEPAIREPPPPAGVTPPPLRAETAFVNSASRREPPAPVSLGPTPVTPASFGSQLLPEAKKDQSSSFVHSPAVAVDQAQPVPLQPPPPAAGIDPPPSRSDSGGSSRRQKPSAAKRATQMYSAAGMAGGATPLPPFVLPAVDPATLLSTAPPPPSAALHQSHPQPIPVEEPLGEVGPDMFNDAPPRPSWSGMQVVSPAPLVRSPEPHDTPTPAKTSVFDMFGHADDTSFGGGDDFFGNLSASLGSTESAVSTISSTSQPPVHPHTPEPQLRSSFDSPELTTVAITPLSTPAATTNISTPIPSSHAHFAGIYTSSSPAVSSPSNFRHAVEEHQAPPSATSGIISATPSVSSSPAVAPVSHVAAATVRLPPSFAPSAQVSTQAMLQKSSDLEAAQRQLVRVEREKEDLSKAYDALILRFREFEAGNHKLQRDFRDLKTKFEETSLEVDSRKELEVDLRRQRDELQAQLLGAVQQLRQHSTQASSNSNAGNQQQLVLLQQDNEQLRRAVAQISRANELLQGQVAAAAAPAASSNMTHAMFEQAVAGVKQQYEDRLKLMQKKLEALLIQQQRSELDLDDLRLQKRDADSRAAQVEKFANEDRLNLQAKLTALQQRALTAETRLASVMGSSNGSSASGSASADSAAEEQRRLVGRQARDITALEQRCASVEAALAQTIRERDSYAASHGESSRNYAMVVAERSELASQVNKLKRGSKPCLSYSILAHFRVPSRLSQSFVFGLLFELVC